MTLYAIALFLHILAALGIFSGLALEWTSTMYLLRSSSMDSFREWLGVSGLPQRLGPVSMVVILLTGFYMMATTWGWVAWIIVTLAALVLMALLGGILTGRTMRVVGGLVGQGGEGALQAVHQQLMDLPIWLSLFTRTAILMEVIFLMTIKPGWTGSLISLVAAILLGIAITFMVRPRQMQQAQLKRAQD